MSATWIALVNGDNEPLNGFSVDGFSGAPSSLIGLKVEVYGQEGVFTVVGCDGERLTLDRPLSHAPLNNAAVYLYGGKP
jgi:hypothetical protein